MRYSEIVKFHGHECPGLAIGYRMASAALDALEARRAVALALDDGHRAGGRRRGRTYRTGSLSPISTMASSASAFPRASFTGWWSCGVFRRCFQVAYASFTMPQ